MKPVLMIFVKAPIMGKAKTRLAAGIGKVHAQRVYRAMCAKVFKECISPQWQTYLYVTPDDCAHKNYGGNWPAHLPRISQGPGGLTERKAKLYTYKGPLIAIGTDIPQLKNRDIARGFKALKTHDAVFGPASDGGFWLIGLIGPAKTGLFEGIRWSHPDTLVDMKRKIDGSIAYVNTYTDVDNARDFALVKAQLYGL